MSAVLCAFHGRAEVRAAALARLAAHIDAGRLHNGPLVWNEQHGSVAGCLAESADVQQWVTRLGLPRWLAHALDAGLADTPREKVLARTTALLNALPLGADVGPLGSRLVCGLLDDAWSAFDESQRPPALSDAMQAVKALHAVCLRRDAPATSEWRGVRQRAMAITDALYEPRQRALAGCAEAAGWNPQDSPTVVSDVMREWKKLESLNADAEFGWTPADDAQIRRLLGALHAAYLVGKPNETRSVFDFLEIHCAEIATRLRAHIRFDKNHHAVCAERAADLLLRLIEVQSP